MSEANVKIVKDAYAAYGKGDHAAVLGMMTPDVTWESVGQEHDFPTFGEVRRGREGVKRILGGIDEGVVFTAFEPQEFYPSGDKVFVLGFFSGTMRAGGRSVKSKFVQIFTLRDGKIAGYTEYQDTGAVGRAFRND
jgi:ketosteroid isomerase-like protein